MIPLFILKWLGRDPESLAKKAKMSQWREECYEVLLSLPPEVEWAKDMVAKAKKQPGQHDRLLLVGLQAAKFNAAMQVHEILFTKLKQRGEQTVRDVKGKLELINGLKEGAEEILEHVNPIIDNGIYKQYLRQCSRDEFDVEISIKPHADLIVQYLNGVISEVDRIFLADVVDQYIDVAKQIYTTKDLLLDMSIDPLIRGSLNLKEEQRIVDLWVVCGSIKVVLSTVCQLTQLPECRVFWIKR